MSESAIESAETAMRESLGEAAPIFFHISDMLSYLQKVRGTFDVIVAAFAIHHLTSEDKQMVDTSALRSSHPNASARKQSERRAHLS